MARKNTLLTAFLNSNYQPKFNFQRIEFKQQKINWHYTFLKFTKKNHARHIRANNDEGRVIT